jgi:predicted NAD/FAD-binding protein
MKPLNIAVVGSGISGLSAAWLLSSRHRVTLYEQDARTGGHSNTVLVQTPEAEVPVDTGFIVYNERNYPNLTALFSHFGVATEPTRMTFSVSCRGGRYEYSGSGLPGLFGQPANLFRLDHWRLIAGVSKFFRTASDRAALYPEDVSLGEFLFRENYPRSFITDHILPMGAAIWSTPARRMLDFSARSFLNFYANHGMLQARNRPQWRTVAGGSKRYVERLLAGSGIEVLSSCKARRIARNPHGAHIEDSRGVVRLFDQVVVATHADQAIGMIADADPLERSVLGAFRYEKNRAVLHRDVRLMPKRRRLWSSWNYLRHGSGDGTPAVSYWMNSLQNLRTSTDLFVTINPPVDIHPKATDAEFIYEHPVFSANAIRMQQRLWSLQGRRRLWFCGSYFGYGFHEDGMQSGLAVEEQLGGVRRPWTVEDESGRIYLGDTAEPALPMEAAE